MEIKTKIISTPMSREEIISEAKELFAKIDAWFFGNDTTHFDPGYLEHLEDCYRVKGYLSKKQLDDLRTIYKTWVVQ